MSPSTINSNPWVLTSELSVTPLKRISPSRYTALKECRLRELWRAGGCSPLLPLAPAAKLGTVIHNLLELAGKGQFANLKFADIDAKFDSLVKDTEATMKQSWLECLMVPLKNIIPDYQVRRIRALKKAAEIAGSMERSQAKTVPKSISEGYELWLESKDGLVGGKIDQIVETNEGSLLRDYKTGYILEKPIDGAVTEVKESYQEQLKLYAALYEDKFGRWPAHLEVVPLSGNAWEINFHPEECKEIFEVAKLLLKDINATVDSRNETSQFNDLATPTEMGCRFCEYRPGCKVYRDQRANSEDQDWLNDIWGEILEQKMLGNGHILLRLEKKNKPKNIFNIRGLSQGKERHPALYETNVGDFVGIYNLRGNMSTGSFVEGPYTIIYKQK